MGVGDGAVVLGGAAGGGVAVDGGLGHLVLDLLAVVEARQAGVGDGVGAVAVVGDGGLLALDRRRELQLGSELVGRQADAVLVVRVAPDLGDLEVGELVVVGVGDGVARLGVLDGARGGLGAFEGGVLALRQLGLVEGEAFGKRALGEGVGGAGGKVGEAEVPAVLHLDGDIGVAGRVVIAVSIRSGSTRDGGVHDRCAGLGVVNREPHPVVGVVLGVVLGSGGGGLGVLDRQREREGRILRRIFSGDDLGQVEVGAAVVDGGKAGSVGVDVVGVAIDRVGRGAGGQRVVLVDHDEHGQLTVDEHRVHDGGLELPVVLLGAELGELEVMAFGARERLIVLDDAGGDEGAGRPAVVFADLGGVERLVVHEHGNLKAIDVGLAALPFLGGGQRGGLGLDGIRVFVGAGLATRAVTGVIPSDARVGVGAEGVAAVVVIDDVLLDLGIELGVLDVAVLQLGDDVVRGLARVAVERDGVAHVVLEDADFGEIPLNRSVYEVGFRRIGPLLHGTVGAAGTVVLVGGLIHHEEVGDLAGGGGHLAGGAVVDLGIGEARHLDLGEDVGDGLVERGGVLRAVVVGRGVGTGIAGQRLHTVDVAESADGEEVGRGNLVGKHNSIIDSMFIAACDSRSGTISRITARTPNSVVAIIISIVVVVMVRIVAFGVAERRVTV